MKATIISSFAVLLALTSAAPTPAPAGGPQASPGTISTLALFGATPEAQYSINVPTTGQITPTGNPLSISHAQNYGSVPCGLLGIDRLLQEIAPGAYIDVGPPQTIFAIACGPKTGQNGW